MPHRPLSAAVARNRVDRAFGGAQGRERRRHAHELEPADELRNAELNRCAVIRLRLNAHHLDGEGHEALRRHRRHVAHPGRDHHCKTAAMRDAFVPS